MNISRFLVEGFSDDLIDKFDNASLFVLNLVNDAGLILHFKVIQIEIPPFEKLLKRVSTNAVELPESLMHPATRSHVPHDWHLNRLSSCLTRH